VNFPIRKATSDGRKWEVRNASWGEKILGRGGGAQHKLYLEKNLLNAALCSVPLTPLARPSRPRGHGETDQLGIAIFTGISFCFLLCNLAGGGGFWWW
jgi:hypothetical protein